MSSEVIGIIGLAVILLLFLTGIELGFAMAVVGFLGFAYIVSFKAALNLLPKDIFDVFANYGFTVIPLFVLMGQIAFNAGIAKRLYNTAYRFIGHIPGGLAMATVVGATAFKAICGSSPATAATFASVAVPEMDRYKYDKKLSTGIVATVGTLGILIPPSVTLIVFGIITEQSIGRLFLAGIIPGLIIAFFFMCIIYVWCRINPSLGPKGERSTWKERIASLPEFLFVGAIFILVVGGLMKGFFTPTEAGSIGTFAVLLLSVVKRDMNFKKFVKSVTESLRTACMVLMLIAGSTILGHFLAVTKIPMVAADWVVQLPFNPYIIMIIISLIYLMGGSFIDDLAFMVLATPIFYPVIIKLGFDPIWFGMIIAITVMIGVVIPPVAINVFVVKNITRTPLSIIYKGIYPFLISLVVCAVLLFWRPGIATFLPYNTLTTNQWIIMSIQVMIIIFGCIVHSFLWAFPLRLAVEWVAKIRLSYKNAYFTHLIYSLATAFFMIVCQLAIGDDKNLSAAIMLAFFILLDFIVVSEIICTRTEITFAKASLVNLLMFAISTGIVLLVGVATLGIRSF